jgi:exopolysaccharide production protein ExoZ
MGSSWLQSNVGRCADPSAAQIMSHSTSSNSSVTAPEADSDSKKTSYPSSYWSRGWSFLAGIYELSDEGNRFRSMEGIRGLAILLVFFVHYHTLFSPYTNSSSLTFRISELSWGLGQSGVDLFFVLSGYLIYGAVIRKPVSYLKFMRRRVQRIYPTFLCVFALYLILCFVFPSVSKLPADAWDATKYVLLNLTLLPGIFPIAPLITVAWSLSYEFFFYISIPLLVMLTAMRRWKRWHRVTFFLALTVLRFTIAPVLPIRMVMFTGGILVYEGLHSEWLRAKLGTRGEVFATIALLASLLPIALLALHQDSPSLSGELSGHGVKLRELLMWFTYPFFVLYCLGRNGFLSKLFSWTPLRWMGNMSYSYYLIHGVTLQGFKLVCQHLWRPEENSSFLFWVLLLPGMLATIVVSTTLFALIEKRYSLEPKTGAPKPSENASAVPERATLGESS